MRGNRSPDRVPESTFLTGRSPRFLCLMAGWGRPLICLICRQRSSPPGVEILAKQDGFHDLVGAVGDGNARSDLDVLREQSGVETAEALLPGNVGDRVAHTRVLPWDAGGDSLHLHAPPDHVKRECDCGRGDPCKAAADERDRDRRNLLAGGRRQPPGAEALVDAVVYGEVRPRLQERRPEPSVQPKQPVVLDDAGHGLQDPVAPAGGLCCEPRPHEVERVRHSAADAPRKAAGDEPPEGVLRRGAADAVREGVREGLVGLLVDEEARGRVWQPVDHRHAVAPPKAENALPPHHVADRGGEPGGPVRLPHGPDLVKDRHSRQGGGDRLRNGTRDSTSKKNFDSLKLINFFSQFDMAYFAACRS
mmetsp:Transcript_32772/g.77686  ORF Transcript_32772/g.77686 Transcript_32772/m.77686 type:complete len:363 (+) Transcript_32772:358-1446(+)